MALAKTLATFACIIIVGWVNHYYGRAMFRTGVARNMEAVFLYRRRSTAVTWAIALLFIFGVLFIH